MTEQNLDGLTDCLKHFLDDIEKFHAFVYVAKRGITMARGLPRAVEVLVKAEGALIKADPNFRRESSQTTHEERLADAQHAAEIASAEIDNGFPFLYSQATLILYANLEAAIKNVIITYFSNNKLDGIKEVANIKISLSEYLSLNENERLDYLFVSYEKMVAAGLQYGVNRFESLLSPIGFSGSVRQKTARTIFSLSQVRNNLLHRGGKADRQLVTCCPWLNFNLNDTVFVTNEMYEEFCDAVMSYITTLIVRIKEKQGVDMSEFKDDGDD